MLSVLTKGTIISHLKYLNIEMTMTYAIGNTCTGLGQTKNVAGLYRIMGFQRPPLIIGSPTTIAR